MPEICEIKTIVEELNDFNFKSLKKVEIVSGKYKKSPPTGLREFDGPYKVKDVKSKGKFIWFEFDNLIIFNTLGLTGCWEKVKTAGTRLTFHFDKEKLHFNDNLGYGTVKFVYKKEELEEKLNNLQDEANETTLEKVTERLNKIKNNKKKIIDVLLDQKTGIVSGIGNYLSAEILYKAGISPHCTIESILDNNYVELLYENMVDVVNNCDDELSVYQRKVDDFNNEVIAENIVKNRKTYWVPVVQKLI